MRTAIPHARVLCVWLVGISIFVTYFIPPLNHKILMTSSSSVNRKYSIVTGFFAQDSPEADGAAIGALPERFGLLDESPQRWNTFKNRIRELNDAAPAGTQYKVFFLSRHGQGMHNVAEAKYGTKLWDEHWSKLDGDGELNWGPDPELTQVGIDQAIAAREAWKREQAFAIPMPQKHYASPLQRALQTFHETFVNGDPLSGKPEKVIILEYLREENGEHTCDKRSPRNVIAHKFSPPMYKFEEGFEEEDLLWTPDTRETKEQVAERAAAVLDRLFTQDTEAYICITAHSGIINGFLKVMGRPSYPLPTGGVLPLVIKAVAA